MRPLESGARVGDFVVESRLGNGGMGVVYRARQIRMDRPVALKILNEEMSEEPDVVRRFIREATIMRDLEHPGVVPVYDAGTSDGRPYLAMRLLEVRTLRDLVADGPLQPEHALRLLTAIADALDHAHARGVVHRDIKPANVLLDAGERPYLTDFGIAKALTDSTQLTVQPGMRGTPLYMPPEQQDGNAGHRSDLYSLACVAFEMLTGTPPFVSDDRNAVLYAHATTPPPAASERRPELPVAVDAVFRRALAKQPLDRFSSAADFVEALRVALDGTARTTPEQTIPEQRTAETLVGRPDVPHRRRRLGWAAAGAAAVAVLAVGGVTAATTLTAGRSAPASAAPVPPASAVATTAPASATAVATGPNALPEPPVPHGALLFSAPFDAAGSGFQYSPGEQLDETTSAFAHPAGSLQMEGKAPGAYVYVQVDIDHPVTNYVADMELSVRPGTDVQQCWSLRWADPGKLAWYWCVDTATGKAGFNRYDNGRRTPLGDTVIVPDLTSGRTLDLTVVVEPEKLTMYLDGALAGSATDDQVPPARTFPGLELAGRKGTGLVTITGLRYWDLPPAAAQQGS